jgi:GDP-L-fucose synthase
MSNSSKIFVAGHAGMVGSAIVRQLRASGYAEEDILLRTSAELDLTDQAAVRAFLASEKPDEVFVAAARVGGIHANTMYPAEFIYQNLMIAVNVIDAAFNNGVRKLMYLGSSCIYPRLAQQPIAESALMTGSLEPSNESYAVAKIAGLKLCESYNKQYGESHGIDYRGLMPTNLFGSGDNYHAENAHVIPAMIRRFHEAVSNRLTEVTIWGTGTPIREFLFVDDLAAACIFVMALDKDAYYANLEVGSAHLNVGSGQEISIKDLATIVAEVVDFKGRIFFDDTKRDGTPRKLLDSKKVKALGWRPRTGLREGLKLAYYDFLQSNGSHRTV